VVRHILDSSSLVEQDRDQAVREIVASTIVPVEIDFPPPGPMLRAALTDVGPLRLASIRSNATRVQRTDRLARDSTTPSVFLGLQMTGSSLVRQDGKEAVLRPGDLVLYESTTAYSLLDLEGFRQHQVRIPIEDLALPRDLLRRVLAVNLSPGSPIADATSAFFQRLAARPETFTEAGLDVLNRPITELVRALVATHLDATALTKESMHESLQLRITQYIRASLADPDLTAAKIAAAHHISVRHLYNVLGAAGISLGDWIRTQRLEAARDDLARAGARLTPIATTARRWGFRDPSHFGRLFRAAYGMSPREWRDGLRPH
jgi:AraC-like DNA-binding protein